MCQGLSVARVNALISISGADDAISSFSAGVAVWGKRRCRAIARDYCREEGCEMSGYAKMAKPLSLLVA